ADQQALGKKGEIHHYVGGFFKTAGLFMRGKLGLAGTVAIYALDQMNPTDGLKTQLADLAMGGAKGGLMKGMFHLMGDKPVNIAAKGVGLGVTSRVLELGLTRGTYTDLRTGEASLQQGFTNVIRGSLSREALAADVIIFGAAHGLMGKANGLSGKAIERSPLLSTMLTGTTFGMSAGAYTEIQRELATGQGLDLSKIIKSSLIQGAIDTVAAGPGGMQARAAAMAVNPSKAAALIASDVERTNGERFGNTVGEAGLPEGVRTFVAGANVQEMLARFDGPEAQRSGLLRVQEILSQGGTLVQHLGPETTLFVQHLAAGQQFDPKAAQGADIVAFCNPEQAHASERVRHVFPDGQGRVWLTVDPTAHVLGLNLGDRPANLELANARSFALGGNDPKPGSGADLEGLLDSHKPPEAPLTGRSGGQRAIGSPELPDAAPGSGQTDPVEKTPGSTTVAGTDRPTEAPAVVSEKLDLLSRVTVRDPEQRAILEEFKGLADKATAAGADASQLQPFAAFLKNHPELEQPIRQYEELLFDSLTTGFKQGELAREEIESRMKLVYLIGEFYKEGRVRVFADNMPQVTAFAYLTGPPERPEQGLFFQLKGDRRTASSATDQLFDFLYRRGPSVPGFEAFHDHVRHYAAASNDRVVVAVLDKCLKTENLAALEQTQAWRAGAQSHTDATSGAGVPALTNPQGSGAGKPGEAASAPDSTTAASSGVSGASGLDALRRARPVRVAGEIPETVTAGAAATSAGEAQEPGAKSVSADKGDTSAPGQAPQVALPGVAEIAKGLVSPDPSARNMAYKLLRDQASSLSDGEFAAWTEVVSDRNILGHVLKRPEIKSLPNALLKRLLSKLEPAVDNSHPQWAAEHVQENKELAEQRARETGRPIRPPRQPKDTLETRLELLEKAFNALKGEPELVKKLLELGVQDRGALDSIFFSLGHPRFGRAYRDLLRATLPHAKQVEAVKYLFEFIKGGYEDGAHAALQQMRPENTETVENLRDWIIAERTVEGKPVGDADAILAEAQQRHAELTRQAEDKWTATRRLVHDIVSGNVQGPPRGPARGGRDGGQGGPR
ncbi:MAG: hypothetical protein HY711_08110, partial [Candidatus Melainabacteria bacterium]|nr:hypothetical protein [Candidatus Melainabacteria bacterium]